MRQAPDTGPVQDHCTVILLDNVPAPLQKTSYSIAISNTSSDGMENRGKVSSKDIRFGVWRQHRIPDFTLIKDNQHKDSKRIALLADSPLDGWVVRKARMYLGSSLNNTQGYRLVVIWR